MTAHILVTTSNELGNDKNVLKNLAQAPNINPTIDR